MKFIKLLIIGAALALTFGSSSATAETKKIALLVKNLGNGFFDAANRGAQEAAKQLGDVEVIYTGPTQATPEGQIDIINSLVAQGVDAIAVSANDADALVPALKKAMDRKITVISFDSGVAKQGRQMESSRFGDGPYRQSMPQDGLGSTQQPERGCCHSLGDVHGNQPECLDRGDEKRRRQIPECQFDNRRLW